MLPPRLVLVLRTQDKWPVGSQWFIQDKKLKFIQAPDYNFTIKISTACPDLYPCLPSSVPGARPRCCSLQDFHSIKGLTSRWPKLSEEWFRQPIESREQGTWGNCEGTTEFNRHKFNANIPWIWGFSLLLSSANRQLEFFESKTILSDVSVINQMSG